MIYSKYLTGNYQGEPYSKEQAKLKGTYDDIYVFDMADFCRIVTARELHKDRNMGESIYDIMTQDGICEMLEYSKTYTDIPMLVKTAYGPALLISSIVPSTSLLVLSYISVGGENLYKYCKLVNLTEKETEICAMVVLDDCSNEKLIKKLDCKESTFYTHLRNITIKFCNHFFYGAEGNLQFKELLLPDIKKATVKIGNLENIEGGCEALREIFRDLYFELKVGLL